MLRHIYRVQQNPTTVFQKLTPSRTTTADVAIKMTAEKSETTEKSDAPAQNQKKSSTGTNAGKAKQNASSRPKPPIRPTQTPENNTSAANANHKKHKATRSESVPFSAVIMICTVFCILAIIGFFLLYTFLCKEKVAEAAPLMSSVCTNIRDIGMEMRLR
jgi:cobalamin biosynthesis Mg chelatase CobN